MVTTTSTEVFRVIEGMWGSSELHQDIIAGSVDLVVMADVLYHEEHFRSLLSTIRYCIQPLGGVILCVEARRKDLVSSRHNLSIY